MKHEDYPKAIEKFAEYAHNSWSGTMFHLFRDCPKDAFGNVTIPKETVERWKKQLFTSYEKLPEIEKRICRIEAERVIATLGKVEKIPYFQNRDTFSCMVRVIFQIRQLELFLNIISLDVLVFNSGIEYAKLLSWKQKKSFPTEDELDEFHSSIAKSINEKVEDGEKDG